MHTISPWRIERFPITDSTNQLAITRTHEAWSRDESAHHLAFIAERQTAGRGQHGRTWQSPSGGLYLSAVVEDVPPEARDRLALIVGVAAVEALHQTANVDTRLRWPNDLLLYGKKVGGILCEGIAQGNRWAAIIGIGLNVNTDLTSLPASLQKRTTSLLAHDGHPHALGEIEHTLLSHLAAQLAAVQQNGVAPVLQRVRQLDDLHGKRILFHDGVRDLHGIAAGIGDAGELLIAIDNHPPQAFSHGSVIAVDGVQLRD
jgi:BirA family biotin operon repressor/biotin-[acetyl-CoA-carboxylase] ligase